MNRSDKKQMLEEEINDWRRRVEKALRRVTNAKRKTCALPALSKDIPVHIPSGSNANMYLLTLKVWCLRYHVTPEWLLEQLLFRFRNNRKTDENSNEINLGLPIHLLIGTVAQNTIHDALLRDFPSSENQKITAMPVPREIKITNLDFSLDDAVKTYTD